MERLCVPCLSRHGSTTVLFCRYIKTEQEEKSILFFAPFVNTWLLLAMPFDSAFCRLLLRVAESDRSIVRVECWRFPSCWSHDREEQQSKWCKNSWLQSSVMISADMSSDGLKELQCHYNITCFDSTLPLLISSLPRQVQDMLHRASTGQPCWKQRIAATATSTGRNNKKECMQPRYNDED